MNGNGGMKLRSRQSNKRFRDFILAEKEEVDGEVPAKKKSSRKSTGEEKEESLIQYCKRAIARQQKSSDAIQCSVCFRNMKTWAIYDILQHCLSHGDVTPFRCRYCDYCSKTKKAMRSHLQRRHPGEICGNDHTDHVNDCQQEIMKWIDKCFEKIQVDDQEPKEKPAWVILLKHATAILESRDSKEFAQCAFCFYNLRRKTVGQCAYDAFAHSLTHMEVSLFHCRYCDHKTKTRCAIKVHLSRDHKLSEHDPHFTDSLAEYKDDIMNMINQCFGKMPKAEMVIKPELLRLGDADDVDLQLFAKDAGGSGIAIIQKVEESFPSDLSNSDDCVSNHSSTGQNGCASSTSPGNNDSPGGNGAPNLTRLRSLAASITLTNRAKAVLEGRPQEIISCSVCSYSLPPNCEPGRRAKTAFIHCLTHMKSAVFQCRRCGFGAKTRDGMRLHLKSAHQLPIHESNFVDMVERYQSEIEALLGHCFGGGESEGVVELRYNLLHYCKGAIARNRAINGFARCHVCSKKFMSSWAPSAALEHCLLHGKIEPISCRHCEFKSKNRRAMRLHLEQKHVDLVNGPGDGDFDVNMEDHQTEIIQLINRCLDGTDVDQEAKDPPTLSILLKETANVLTENGGPYGVVHCTICSYDLPPKTIGQRANIALFHALIHTNIEAFHCRYCEHSGKTKRAIKWHLKKDHELKYDQAHFTDSLVNYESEIKEIVVRCFGKGSGDAKKGEEESTDCGMSAKEAEPMEEANEDIELLEEDEMEEEQSPNIETSAPVTPKSPTCQIANDSTTPSIPPPPLARKGLRNIAPANHRPFEISPAALANGFSIFVQEGAPITAVDLTPIILIGPPAAPQLAPVSQAPPPPPSLQAIPLSQAPTVDHTFAMTTSKSDQVVITSTQLSSVKSRKGKRSLLPAHRQRMQRAERERIAQLNDAIEHQEPPQPMPQLRRIVPAPPQVNTHSVVVVLKP